MSIKANRKRHAFAYRVKRARTWESAKTILSQFSRQALFRGQLDSTWALETSLERTARLNGLEVRRAEEILLNRFKAEAHLVLQPNEMPKTDVQWFAVIQHHGGPTRLLDWTWSPFVAAYFAFEEACERPPAYVAIWIIPGQAIGAYERFRLDVLEEVSPSSDEAIRSYFLEDPGFRAVHYHDGVFIWEPGLKNRRMVAQQGLFLWAGNPELSFEKNLDFTVNDSWDMMLKLEIPYTERAVALAELEHMNINRATLFPGLDGLAQSLKTRLAIRSHSLMAEYKTETRIISDFRGTLPYGPDF